MADGFEKVCQFIQDLAGEGFEKKLGVVCEREKEAKLRGKVFLAT